MSANESPNTASVEALHRVVRAANKLASAAMTTGGVAGTDAGLQQAIDHYITEKDAALAAARQEVVQHPNTCDCLDTANDHASNCATPLAEMQRRQEVVQEALCTGCGNPTMHMGTVCYACSHPASPSPAQAEPLAEIAASEYGNTLVIRMGVDEWRAKFPAGTLFYGHPPAQAGDTGRGEVARIADEMEAWAEKKMGGPGSSRIDRAMVREWAGQLRAADDSEADAYVIEQMGRLLAEIAVIVKGPEPANGRWSYHDLPKLVAQLEQRTHRAPCCGVCEGELHRDGCTPPTEASAAQAGEAFCDGHCTWAEHHPDCHRAARTDAGGADSGLAAEYRDWIDFHHAGEGDFDDFMRQRYPDDAARTATQDAKERGDG